MKSVTTIRLPDNLLALARKKARERGTTLTALLEEGLREVVSERPAPAEPRRVKLPISAAKGGLLPGIDAVKLSTHAQEEDDLDYVERMKRSP
ncbi:MAG: DUF2191 domain-containing protein [Pseudomonadota bacterium]